MTTNPRLAVPLFGVDSTGQVPVHSAQSLGVHHVERYLSRFTPKVITRKEVADNKAAGFGTVLVFEDGAANALMGYAQGKSDAQWSLNQAVGLGITGPGLCVRYAVDFDPSAHAFDATDPYDDGWCSVFPRMFTGPYGAYRIVQRAFDRGELQPWQTYAWSGGLVDPRVTLLQYSNGHSIGGVGVDFNHAFYQNYGQIGFVAPVVDPHNYLRFPEFRVDWRGIRKMHPRQIVIRYDTIRASNVLMIRHHNEYAQLRRECLVLAERVAYLAHERYLKIHGHDKSTKSFSFDWTPNHWGWQFGQFTQRAGGKKVV